MAITGTTILVPYLEVKSLQLIWRSGTRRWNLRVPDLQMNCRLDYMIGYQDSNPSNGYQADIPYWSPNYLHRQFESGSLTPVNIQSPSSGQWGQQRWIVASGLSNAIIAPRLSCLIELPTVFHWKSIVSIMPTLSSYLASCQLCHHS